MIHRSFYGYINRDILSDCDFVVYVEGKHEDEAEITNPDELFWQNILSHYHIENVRVISIGGKQFLRNFAEQLMQADDIEHVKIALDSDYDDFNGQKLNAESVMYTYGYGWENDTLNESVLCNVLEFVSPSGQEFLDIMNRRIETFCSDIENAIKCDIAMIAQGESLLPKQRSCGRIIEHDGGSFPFLKLEEIETDIEGIDATIYPRKNCPAHLFHFYCYQLFRYCQINILKLRPFEALTKRQFNILCIRDFIANLHNLPELESHYANQVGEAFGGGGARQAVAN